MALPVHGSSVENSGGGTTLASPSITVTGTDAGLIVTIQYKDNAGGSIVSVVWDAAGVNESLTQLGSEVNGGNANASIWYRAAPTAKSAVVTITFSATRRACMSAHVYTGVDQTNPFRAAAVATNTGTNDTPTVGVVALNDELVIDSMAQVSAGPDTATGDHTERHDNAATGGGTDTRGAAQEKSSTGATETMQYTMGGAEDWSIIAAPLQEPQASDTPYFVGKPIWIG